MSATDTKIYDVQGMTCSGCAREVETGVSKLSGVTSATVDYSTMKMRVIGDVPFVTLQERVQALGKTLVEPVPEDAPIQSTPIKRGGIVGFWDYLVGRRETRFALVGGAIVLATFVLNLVGLAQTPAFALYIVGLLVTLVPIARSGINTLLINREFNINLLMTIAAVGAVLIGEVLEGATVIFLFAIGEALEGYTADRARNSIRSLMSLRPTDAIRLRGTLEERVSVNALAIDDLIVVKPGENMPMDGVITQGASSLNQAPITGESVPVSKEMGDDVFAGSINGEGALVVRITRLAADNTLSRIIKMVEEAQSVRAPSQRLIDRFAHYYTPMVVVIAALVAFVPPILFNAPFYDTALEHGWLYRALSMLVIACPCALVISTPVTVISAITAAARRGVLIKGGAHLEALGTVKAFAFDKTGTLTQGNPQVTMVHAVNCEGDEDCDPCNDMLALASSVEQRASHPLAKAIVNAANQRGINGRFAVAESVETLAGLGVRGNVAGHTITVGSHRLFDRDYPHSDALCSQVQNAEANGQTTMLIADKDHVRGFVALADAARGNSKNVIASLNELGMTTIMLTGDNASVAKRIANELGVNEVRAELMPQDKVSEVQQLTERYQRVAMVGDGVNDTPALAAATVGIAMGGAGSPQALETADVVLMADDLAQLPYAVKLSRFARRLIVQNVVLSFGLKAVFLVLALMGMTTLWMAIFADVGMSLIVTLNGMRPLRFEKQPSTLTLLPKEKE